MVGRWPRPARNIAREKYAKGRTPGSPAPTRCIGCEFSRETAIRNDRATWVCPGCGLRQGSPNYRGPPRERR